MKELLDFSNLFELGDPLSNRPIRLETEDDSLTAEIAFNITTGQVIPKIPIVFQAGMGGKLVTDVLWSTGYLLCISQRVVDIFLDNRFTGWKLYPAKVYGWHNEELPGYYGLVIPGDAGPMDITRSELTTKEQYTEIPRKAYKGIAFNQDLWDGSDIFRIGGGFIIVTKRTRDAFIKARIKNVKFTALSEMELSDSHVECTASLAAQVNLLNSDANQQS